MIAVVLAGGPPDDVSALQPGAPNKAFVRVAGRTLVERVLTALRASSAVDRIIAVAPSAMRGDAALALADECRPDGIRISESLRSGLEGLPVNELVLVATSDLPILTPGAIDDFAARALALDGEIGYGCVERSVHRAKYAEVPHTWARLRDGVFCGGGLVALRPRVLPALERFIERLGAARKKPWRLASLFGFRVLAKYALGRLSIADAEARARELLGAQVRAVISPYAETAVNVDRASDVALAERLVTTKEYGAESRRSR
ncbi:MAG TPA: nucleotidyltransferase family protein [Candidatus Tyrphobacter sp.]